MNDSSGDTFVSTVKDYDEEYNGYEYNSEGCGCFVLLPLIFTFLSIILLIIYVSF